MGFAIIQELLKEEYGYDSAIDILAIGQIKQVEVSKVVNEDVKVGFRDIMKIMGLGMKYKESHFIEIL